MRPTGGHDRGLRPMPRVRPMPRAFVQHVIILLRAADACRLHPHARREIRRTQAHRVQPRAARRDLFDMRDASRRFDNYLKTDRLLAPLGPFHCRHQRIDGVNVRRAAYLGDHDLIQPVAGLFQQIHHVAIPVGRVEAIDPHAQILLAPIDLMRRGNDVRARRRLVVRRDGVLQIKVDHIRSARRHLLEQRGARAGPEQLATVGAGWGGRLKTEGHAGSPGNVIAHSVRHSV
ncbi:hypothetical protein GALL_547710 [mine drainage metagenome]|uniref:Uncharacterized protein n=1 Tax=mine drainage metagenome TaxID=410659 RepID=A0A1J5NZL4_9ZZZZ